MRPISYHFNMRRILVWILAMLMVSLLYAGSWGVGIEAGYTLGLYDQRGGISDFERYSPGHAFRHHLPGSYHTHITQPTDAWAQPKVAEPITYLIPYAQEVSPDAYLRL